MKRVELNDFNNEFKSSSTKLTTHGKIGSFIEKVALTAALSATMIVPSEAKASGVAGIFKLIGEFTASQIQEKEKQEMISMDSITVDDPTLQAYRGSIASTPTGKSSLNQDYLDNLQSNENHLGMK